MAARKKRRLSHRFEFPDDFPRRIERFKERSGLSWGGLARKLGVTPYRLREWRRGVKPDARNFMRLLTVAHALGLVDVLLSPAEHEVTGRSGESELPSEPSPHPQSVRSGAL